MTTLTNRIILNGISIRFYLARKDAIRAANALTKIRDLQHNPKYAPNYGWCVKGVDGAYYDADGLLSTSLDNECKQVRKVKS